MGWGGRIKNLLFLEQQKALFAGLSQVRNRVENLPTRPWRTH